MCAGSFIEVVNDRCGTPFLLISYRVTVNEFEHHTFGDPCPSLGGIFGGIYCAPINGCRWSAAAFLICGVSDRLDSGGYFSFLVFILHR